MLWEQNSFLVPSNGSQLGTTPADSMLYSPSRTHSQERQPTPQLLVCLGLPTGLNLEARVEPFHWVLSAVPRLWSTHSNVAAPWQCLAVESVKSKAKIPRGMCGSRFLFSPGHLIQPQKLPSRRLYSTRIASAGA